MYHLMAYVTDVLRLEVTRKALWRYMTDHGFAYKLATTRDRLRIVSREDQILSFYQNLENDLDGVNPCLVYNVDEMGVEMYADRKDIMVFVRIENVPEIGNLFVGVERSRRRITMIACICLDGGKLIPTILTKTKTINSLLFDRGYSVDDVKILSTENSFLTAVTFEIWLNEVFLPAVRKRGER